MNRYVETKDGMYVPKGIVLLSQIIKIENDLDALEKLLRISLIEFKTSEDLLECVIYTLVSKMIHINFSRAMKIFMKTVFPLRSIPTISALMLRSVFMFMSRNFDNYKYTAIKKKWIVATVKHGMILSDNRWYETIANSKKFKKHIINKWNLPITRIISTPAYDNIIKSNFRCGLYESEDWHVTFYPYEIILSSIQIIKFLAKRAPSNLSFDRRKFIFNSDHKPNSKKLYIISKLILSEYPESMSDYFEVSNRLDEFKLALFIMHRRKNGHWIKFNKHYQIITTIYQTFITKNLTRLALYF